MDNREAQKLKEIADAKYAFLRNTEYNITGTDKGIGFLETYPPDETGSPRYPRPEELPLGKVGVSVVDSRVTPSDVAADIFSHVDKEGIKYRDDLASTIRFSQEQGLAKQYLDYKTTLDEGSPNAERRALDNAISAVMRTSVFGQGGERAKRGLSALRFDVEQQNVLNNAKRYVNTGNASDSMASLKQYLINSK